MMSSPTPIRSLTTDGETAAAALDQGRLVGATDGKRAPGAHGLRIPPEIRRRGAQRRWIAAGSALAALLVVGAYFATRSEEETIRYRTAVIAQQDITRIVEATGQLDVHSRVEVPAPGLGRLVKVLVEAGESVTRGQPLAQLDERASLIGVRTAKAALQAASSRVSEAQAALAAAEDARQRAERLSERGLASESELETARAQEARTRASLSAARAERSASSENLTAANLEQSSNSMIAPVAGVVLVVPNAVGAATTPERGPLFIIGSGLDELAVEALVAESEIGELSVGQEAEFTVPAYTTKTFRARVRRIGVDARRNGIAVKYPVMLDASNPDHLLKPGMTATLRIEVARAQAVLATREAAFRFRPEGAPDAALRSQLWRWRGNRLEPIAVRAGLSDGAFTELVPEAPNSLSAGDEVVIGLLASGQPSTASPGITLRKRR